MPSIDLIPREDRISCAAASWTNILPADWSREYVGVGVGPTPSTYYISQSPVTDLTTPAVLATGITNTIAFELWLERHRTLVCAEWWLYNTDAMNAHYIVVWTVRRIYRTPKPSGLLIPANNGRHGIDDLSSYDPVKMETLLNQMRLETRKVANAHT